MNVVGVVVVVIVVVADAVAVVDFLRRDGADVEAGIAVVADDVGGGTKSDDKTAVEMAGSVEDKAAASDCPGVVVAVVGATPMRALRRRGCSVVES